MAPAHNFSRLHWTVFLNKMLAKHKENASFSDTLPFAVERRAGLLSRLHFCQIKIRLQAKMTVCVIL
jgi:hypothetical protein